MTCKWAGQNALDLLAALVRAPEEQAGREPRIVAAYCSAEFRLMDPLGVLLADLAHGELTTQLELGPLTQKDVGKLLTAPLADLPGHQHELQRRLAERGDGVPFFW